MQYSARYIIASYEYEVPTHYDNNMIMHMQNIYYYAPA